ncbi:sensor histidine kinase [Kribbella sp. NBC_01505]|uniref:sensor histidine kinase n=1 Tax=Kribbella sp. NBC_01505 TaxID=2903580 RepID=UPI00386C91B2
MGGPAGRIRSRSLVADCLLALTILAISVLHLIGKASETNQLDLTAGIGACVFACGALVFRRAAPFTVLTLTTLAVVAFTVTEQIKSPIALSMAAAVYTVVTRKDARTRTIVIGIAAIGTVVVSSVFTSGDLFTNVFSAILVLFAAVLGEAVRYREAYLAEAEQRLLRAEQFRQEEGERRLMEERLRIAHELHDVIAHHIALMNVQAGVASQLLREQPDEADEALVLVRQNGRTVLQELTVLLGVLRQPGTSMPTAPAPGLNDLESLIGSFTAAGLQIVRRSTPTPPLVVPEVIGLTAYRILQESLTNVVKHAPGTVVQVRCEQRPGSLLIEVVNDGPPYQSSNNTTGHGLLGMRERVSAVGGELSAGPLPDGGFRVHAVIPLENGAVSDDSGAAGRRPDVDPQRVPRAGERGARTRGGG